VVDSNKESNDGLAKFFDNQIEREWLSTKQAANFLSVSPNALRIMVYRGQIPVYKVGKRLRFRISDCQALFIKKGA
jgi:excisionase family DNA binding protein